MAQLKVLHVLEALQAGAARHVVDVVRHTPGVVHEVAIPSRRVGWVTDETAKAALTDAGAVIHVVEMRRIPPHPRNGAAFVQLRRLMATRAPDIVHGHSSVGGALSRLAATPPVRRVYTPNGIATSRVALGLERWLGRRTDRFIAVSQSEANQAVSAHLVGEDRLAVIPNGITVDVPTPVLSLRTELRLPAGIPLVGCVARLVPQKAPEDFARMCGLLAARTDAHFLLIGAGPLQGAVDKVVADTGLGHRWHHLPELENAASVLGQLDVFVLSSRFEGLPYTALEAMRAGTPVVLTDVVGSRDTIENGVSGLLVPQGDVDALADRVARLLGDDGLRAKLAAGGRHRLLELFDVRRMGERVAEVYEAVVAAPRAG